MVEYSQVITPGGATLWIKNDIKKERHFWARVRSIICCTMVTAGWLIFITILLAMVGIWTPFNWLVDLIVLCKL